MTAIAKKALVQQPHERRVQRFAFLALAGLTILGVVLALRSPGRLGPMEVPAAAMLGLVILGAAVGVAGIVRRAVVLATVGAALVVLGLAPGGELAPGVLGYALGLVFGALVVAFCELVHMTTRYETAHKLVEEEGVPEESLDRVTDEAVRTLGSRAGLALALAAGGALLALSLATAGPRAFREGLETGAPLGVAVASLVLYSILMLYVLVRGSSLRPDAPDQEAAP